MPATAWGLCGPTYETRDPLWTAERVYNWYPSVDESEHAASKIQLSPVPGLRTFATLPEAPVRGLWVGDDRLFAVGGSRLCEISAGGGITLNHAISSAPTPVQFAQAAEGLELLVATGDKIWRDDGVTATQVYDGAVSVVSLDGYYVILLEDSNRMHFSLGSGGATWDPLDFIDKSPSADRSVRLETHEGHIWVFGRQTIVPYYNSGDADNPWQPIAGAVMEAGTSAPYSVAKIDQTLYWLGQDYNGNGRVYRSQGYTPVRISNMAIEHLIGQYLGISSDPLITGSGYTENGHTFYVLSFPLAQATLVYDLTTNMWHERARWNASSWEHWRGSGFHANVFGRHYTARTKASPFPAGDEQKIYEQGNLIATDDTRLIRRYRTSPYVSADQQWLFHHYMRLLVNGVAPVSMRYQLDDGGFSTARQITPFKNEVKYRRLGRARDRLYEVSLFDSTDRSTSIIEGYLHATPGVER